MRFEELHPNHVAPFLDFVADLRARDHRTFARTLDQAWSPDAFAAFVARAAAERLDWRPKARQTSRTRYLLLDHEGVAGFALLQFPLGPAAPDNFQFVVPPSRRGRGFGTLTLNRLLFEGARAGLARARVSCRADDPAGRRCITLNRGEWIVDEDGRSSFWLKLR